jgi:D-arabinose 1-dehydrogenase-like Zn-dependent alcohol dehydrogenase
VTEWIAGVAVIAGSSMSRINDAFARLESGKARYRIVLDAGF